MNRRHLLSAALAAGLLSAARTATADPAVPPTPVAEALGEARLAGDGDLRWFGLKVYTAQLWVGPRGLRPERIDAEPFALQLRYAMRLEGTAIADRSLEEMVRMGFGDAAQRTRWLADMKRVFPDVVSGDRLTGVHAPGRPTRFFHNERAVGAMEDPAFPGAFFAIWLDARTVAPRLRDTLLRGAGDIARAVR
jgi:hypothetical protein